MKKKIFLFTSTFPYGKGEAQLESELKVIHQQFQIHIFPAETKAPSRSYPDTIIVEEHDHNYSSKRIRLLINNIFFISNILFKELIYQKKRVSFFRHIYSQIRILIQCLYIAEQLDKRIRKEDIKNIIFYSYWFDKWAIILSILKKKSCIPGFISRAHGFDLYEERRKAGFIPFRYLQLKNTDKVFADSKHGMYYLQQRHPRFKYKVGFSYYGSLDQGINSFRKDEIFTIVSCSAAVPVKRLKLIPDILKHLKFKIKWVHFGDGPELTEIKKMVKTLPLNVEADLKGFIPNEQILQFYRNYPVNLFINTSESEGLPMALIEACSFGIPLMATDAGGSSEIVNRRTGILIPCSFDPGKTAQQISDFRNSNQNSTDFRKQVREYWAENFNGEENYVEFMKEITPR